MLRLLPTKTPVDLCPSAPYYYAPHVALGRREVLTSKIPVQAFTSQISKLENATEGELLERISHRLATERNKHQPTLMKLTVHSQLSLLLDCGWWATDVASSVPFHTPTQSRQAAAAPWAHPPPRPQPCSPTRTGRPGNRGP